MPGYHVSTVDPPRGGIVCPHCKLILRNAVQTTGEGHRLCESCYKEISSLPNRTCADCGISLGPEESFYPDRAVRRDVLQTNVRCSYHTNGCVWVGQLQNMEEHRRQCRHQPVCCPNEGCGQLLVPDKLDKHIDEECPYRRVKCEHCGQQERANSLEEHYSVCPKFPIECSQCQERVSIDGLDYHQQHSCSYVVCPVGDCGQKLFPSSQPTDNQLTSDHLRDSNTLFYHIQDLGIAVGANKTLLHQLQSNLKGRGAHSGQPEGDRDMRNVENRLTELQRMVENSRRLTEKRLEELQLKLKQRSEEIQQLQQKLRTVEQQHKDIQRSHQPSAYGTRTADRRMTSQSDNCHSCQFVGSPSEVQAHVLNGECRQPNKSFVRNESPTGPFVRANPWDVLSKKRISDEIARLSTEQPGGTQPTSPVVVQGDHAGKERVVALEKKMEELERQTSLVRVHVSELELQLQASLASTHDGTFLWRIPDVPRRKRDAMDERITSIYSPPFYTGRNGYKMCIRAYLNGDGIGYMTHLSLFFVLMKGEYDPLLKWPFDCKVSLILVDQNHRRHIVQTFKPSAESSNFQRPRSDMNVASGCPQFAKLTVLDDKNYVKDDVMFIKCIVDTSKIFHP